MTYVTRLSTCLCLAILCALVSGCPATSDPPIDDGDMAKVNKNGKCTPGDNKNCGCLGSTVIGMKTCGDDATWGACEGCDAQPGDMATTPQCTNCTGCCQGSVCIELSSQTNAQCGGGGMTCQSCGADTCDKTNGTCTTATSPTCATTCGGCCNGTGGCVAPANTSYTACGASGATCKTCAAGLKCEAGACAQKIDPKLTYQLTFTQIDYSDPAAQAYDQSDETNPDAYMQVTFVDAGGQTRTNSSGYCDTMQICNMSRALGLIRATQVQGHDASLSNAPLRIPGSVLIAGGVTIKAMDWDPISNDLVASGTLPAMTALNYGTVLLYGPYGAGKVKIKYEVLWDVATMP